MTRSHHSASAVSLIAALFAFAFIGCKEAERSTTPADAEAPDCSPGQKVCDGTLVMSCTANGEWDDGKPCNYACVDGACVGECSPGEADCVGNTPRHCSASFAWDEGEPCDHGCSKGECVSQCAPGARQCNGLIPQTCDVAGSWQDGEPCPSFGGTASCVEGECALECGAVNGVAYEDCNHEPGDGCEARLDTTVNCGGCGNACSKLHATPSCVSGQCHLSCDAGHADCNADQADGCEVDTTTDTMNCGACANVCGALNAKPSCASGNCELACEIGHADCNSDTSDGCECSNGVLDSGFATMEVDSIAADDTNVFVATHYDQYYLRKYSSKDGNTWEPLVVNDDTRLGALAVDDTFVYWLYNAPVERAAVMKMPKAGGVATVLESSYAAQNQILWSTRSAVDHTHFYWSRGWNPETGTVCRVALTGGSFQQVATNQPAPQGITTDDDFVYWVNGGIASCSGSLVRLSKAGGQPETMLSALCSPQHVTIANGYVYVGGAGISRVPQQGGIEESLYTSATWIGGLVVAPNAMYWLESSAGLFALPNGAASPVNLVGPSAPYSGSLLVANSRFLYWSAVTEVLWSAK